jgi:hypothetical protein
MPLSADSLLQRQHFYRPLFAIAVALLHVLAIHGLINTRYTMSQAEPSTQSITWIPLPPAAPIPPLPLILPSQVKTDAPPLPLSLPQLPSIVIAPDSESSALNVLKQYTICSLPEQVGPWLEDRQRCEKMRRELYNRPSSTLPKPDEQLTLKFERERKERDTPTRLPCFARGDKVNARKCSSDPIWRDDPFK